MKILLLGNSLNSMIQFRWEIIKYLANKHHQVYIVCPLDIENYELTYQYKNVFFFNINFCRSVNLAKDFITLLQLKKIIKKINPDVIFSYSLKSSFFSMFDNWKIPNVYFITGMGSSLINKYKFLIEKIIYTLTHIRKAIIKHADFFIFLNDDDRNYFIKKKFCLKKNAIVFPGEGVNLEFFKFSPINERQKPISFLFIGRLIRDKGILELINACKKLKSNQIPFNCTVIAPFDYFNPSSLHTMNLDEFQKMGIHYLSYVDDVRTYIAACDVVVLPSYSEGLPRVLLESMAMGRPIITTDTHGCRELVNQDNGILIKPKDMQSLYSAMVCMSKKTRSELNVLGLAGFKRVKEKYSLSSVINNYQALIDNRVNIE
jgi:glycosyltransferase involved in cell wall biosynthesis